MTITMGEPGSAEAVTDQETVQQLQRRLGELLALYRRAAGLSQPDLAQQLGRSRSALSKVEHGHRSMPEAVWVLADELCGAQGVLVAEHNALAVAQESYREWCQTCRRQTQQNTAQAELEALHSTPGPVASGAALVVDQHGMWLAGVGCELAEEFMAVVKRLVRSLGRRDALRVAGWALTVLGLSADLDPDEYARVAQAVAAPSRVDAQTITSLATTLAHCKRLEDQLGPREVLDTVIAQHQLVRRLLTGCPEQLRTPLRIVDSNMAAAIGGYLIDMGHPGQAKHFFDSARRAAHDAHHPALAAYAAANSSFTAYLSGDTPTALDAAAAARSLAARTNDFQLKALAERKAAAAYALNGQYDACMAARDRAHNHIANTSMSLPESPAYWVDHAVIDSGFSTYLTQLNRPKQAVEAATIAQKNYDKNRVGGYALCEVRLGHALVLSKEITEAARVLGGVADQAHLFPRLEADLRTARHQMQPWAHTPAVRTLDNQLRAYGLTNNMYRSKFREPLN